MVSSWRLGVARRHPRCWSPRWPGDTCWFRDAPCSSVGLRWTMKLWDSLTTCLILLSVIRAGLSRQHSAKRRRSDAESPLELPPAQTRLARSGMGRGWGEKLPGGGKGKDIESKYTLRRKVLLFKNKENRKNDTEIIGACIIYCPSQKNYNLFHLLYYIFLLCFVSLIISAPFNLYWVIYWTIYLRIMFNFETLFDQVGLQIPLKRFLP